MPKLLTAFIDLLFPPSTDHLILRDTNPDVWPTLYHPNRFQGVTYISSYRHTTIQAAVRENKFQHNRQAAQLLGGLLAQWYETQPRYQTDTVFIPIPLGPKRQRKRGHNQVLTILQAAKLTDQTCTDIIRRNTETKPQSHLDKRDRLANVKQAFSYVGSTSALQSHKHIVLLDDVVTTGTTMRAAKAALYPHVPPHATLTCLALAH